MLEKHIVKLIILLFIENHILNFCHIPNKRVPYLNSANLPLDLTKFTKSHFPLHWPFSCDNGEF